ncbi:MAG: hypothetical protein KAQ99_04655, partial [Candidatus Aureabacteria bacterium]|nr:hypothetical protein [Candidatus Auribacterota bacterium]
MTRGTIKDVNTLTFTRGRAATTGPVEIAYYVVELTDSSSLVQKGSTPLPALTSTDTATLTDPVDTSRAFPIISTSVTGGTNLSLCDGWVRANLSAPNTLSFSRMTSLINTNIDWFVVELAPLTLKTPNGNIDNKEQWVVEDIEIITWEYADSLSSGGSCAESGYEGHHLVDITLSTNSGADGYPLSITAGYRATTGTFSWEIPATLAPGTVNIITEQARVKITDTDMTTRNYDVSNNDFSIRGSLIITEPIGTESYLINQTEQTIKWDHTGEIGFIDITMDTDGSLTFSTTIQTDYDGTAASAPWPLGLIPDNATAQGKIKIVDKDDPTGLVVTITPGVFEIRPGLEVTSPIDTDQWCVGRDNDITWTKYGTLGNVDISVSYNSGVDWEPIPGATGVAGTYVGDTGTWIWPIDPATTRSTTCKIKIVKSDNPNAVDTGPDIVTDGVFEIMSSLDITGPAISETLRVLQVPDSGAGISWNIGGGPVGNVELKYCTDYSTAKTWVTIPGADNLSSGSSPFAWDVDLNIGTDVGIRIEEKDNPTLIKDESGPYEVKGTINVSTPTLNETLRVGGDRLIEWTHKGNIGNVSIALSTGAGYVDLYTGIPVTALNKNWVGIPDDRSETCKVKVYLASEPNPDTGTAGESPLFRIRGDITNAVTDLSSYNLGGDCVITWTATPADWADNVKILYSINSGGDYPDPAQLITTVPASDQTYTWANIPDQDLLYSTDRIKVQHVSFADTFDQTLNFSILGSINIPNTAQIDNPANIPAPGYWEVGDNRPIEWDVTGVVGDVHLYYKYGGGAWQQVKDAIGTAVIVNCPVTGSYSYNWDLSYIDEGVKVIGDNERYTDVKFQVKIPSGAVADESTTAITIQSKISNVTPTGLSTEFEVYADDEVYSIIGWTTFGYLPTVDIEYDTAGGTGGFGNSIFSGLSNADGYNLWEVPDIIGDAVKVRVMSSAKSTFIYKDSADSFKVKGQIKIITPDPVTNGATVWEVDRFVADAAFESIKNIQWKCFGSLGGTLKIQYASDGENFSDLFTNVSRGHNVLYSSDPWTIPDNIGSENKIRFVNTDAVNTPADEATSAKFTIKGKLKLVEPAGGEPYSISTAQTIKWKYAGTISGNLDFYLDDNGGNNLYLTQINQSGTIAYNLAENTYVCEYGWTTPATVGTKYSIKIAPADAAQADEVTTDVTNFPVKGIVTLGYPGKGGGEVWYVDDADSVNRRIDWTAEGGITAVDIYLDTDSSDGVTNERPVVLDHNEATQKPYEWMIPDAPTKIGVTSDKCRILIYDSIDNTVGDESSVDFKIKPVATLNVLPGTPWAVKETPIISWTSEGNIGKVRVYYSNDDKATWNVAKNSVAFTPGGAGSTSWYIDPAGFEKVTETGKFSYIKLVRYDGDVEDTDIGISDPSPGFNIYGLLTLNSPATSQEYNVLGIVPINWSVEGAVGNVEIKYSIENPTYSNASFTGHIAGPLPANQCDVNGNYDITIPNDPQPNVKIRIREVNNPNIVHVDTPVCKFKGNLLFDQGTTEGLNLTVGSEHTISWTNVGDYTSTYIKVSYRKDIGQWLEIDWNLAGGGDGVQSCQWTPGDNDISNDVDFKVEVGNDSTVYKETDGVGASNTVSGSLLLEIPTLSTDEYIVGQPGTISWLKYGNIGDLKMELNVGTGWLNNSSDGTNLSDNQNAGASGSTQFFNTWSVPDKITNDGQIRITSTSYPALTDETEAIKKFKIKGTFNSISTPVVSTIWKVGDDHTITWDATGDMDGQGVKIEIWTPLGGYEVIENNYGVGTLQSGTNSYTWIYTGAALQDKMTDQCKIKISSVTHTDVSIETLDPFKFIPKITVTDQPAQVVAETQPTIDWTYTGTKLSTVAIIFDPNGD